MERREITLAHNRKYTLSKSIFKRLRVKGLVLICAKCGDPLRVGEPVISKKGHSRVKSRLYHLGCYEKLFLN